MKKLLLFTLLAVSLLELPQLLTDTTRFTSYIAHMIADDNFHEVVSSNFYRAGEMEHQKLAETIDRFNIKTVIDLRLGEDEKGDDGLFERDVVREHKGQYFHISFRASQIPSYSKLLKLVSVFRAAERPVLVHCTSGTHRSGVAAFIWLMEEEEVDITTALEQLSVQYGFFRVERRLKAFVQGKPTLDDIVWRFRNERQEKESFHDWASRTLNTGV